MKRKVAAVQYENMLSGAKIGLILFVLLTPVVVTVYSITRGNAQHAYAATPATLNFQARLMTSSGNLVPDGNYNIEFKIYNAATSGTSSQGSCSGDANCLWTETRTGGSQIQVKNGYLSAYLGDVTALPSGIWDQQLWLTMNIGGTGSPAWDGEMTPRIRLTSVPYAFQARSSETLNKQTGSFSASVDFANMTADRRFLFPDTSLATTASPGTICVFNGDTSNCPAATGSAYYIHNDLGVQTDGNFNLQARNNGASGTVVGVLQGAAGGQTVDLLQFKSSGGSVLAAVTAAGDFRTAGGVDTYGAATLSVGTANATAISIGATGVTTTIGGAVVVDESADFNDTVSVTGLATLSGGIVVPSTGNVAFERSTTDYLGVGTQDDVDFGSGVLFRIASPSALTITSIAGGTDGRIMTLVNASANNVMITNDAGGTAANRVITGTAEDFIVPAGSTVQLAYDSSSNRWRIIGGSAAASSGANKQLSNLNNTAINTNLLPNIGNTHDLGSSSNGWRTLYADTSVLTPSIDTGGAVTLSVGTVNATAVSIGQSGMTTTVNGTLAVGGSGQFTVTELGVVIAGTWQGSSIADAYIDDNITISSSGSVDWTALQNYPAACPTGQAITQLGDTSVCAAFAVGSAADYIQNQNTSAQVSNFWIDGTGRSDTGFLAPTFDIATAATLNIGTSNATAIIIGQSGVTTTVAGGLIVAEAGQFDGGLTSNGDFTVTNAGNVAFQRNTSDYSAVGAQDNVNFGSGVLFRIISASALTINGIAGGADGRIITLANASAVDVTLGNSASGTAANSIITGTGGALVVPAGSTVQLAYDSADNVWRVIGGTATGGGGANQQLSNLSGTIAINKDLIPGASYDNLLDLGSSSYGWRSLYADTSVLTPLVGRATAGTLEIGTDANSTALTISRTGVLTTVAGSLQVNEAMELRGGLTVTSGGNVAIQRNIANYTATGTQNNVNFGTGSLFRITSTAALTITSIANPTDGRIITLMNASTVAVTLQNDSGGTAANRIITGTGGSLVVPAGSTVQLAYDSGSSRWRVIGGTATQGGAANQQLSNLSGTVAINQSLIPGAAYDNLLDLGSSSYGWRTVYADTSVLTPTLDTATAAALNIGTSNAAVINLNQNTVLAAGKSLTVTGGNTASRPGTPTEGMVYYDTTTKRLLTYANGKWQADRSDSILVAASNSSQTDKDAADYVTTGTGDQTIINSALTAGAGKKVTLLAGTYTITGSISVPNNTTLSGVGEGTLITIPNGFNSSINMIINTSSTGTGVVVEDLRLDGNTAQQTGGVINGITFTNMGDSASNRTGAKIRGTSIGSFRSSGIYLLNSANNTIQGNILTNIGKGSTDVAGIYLDGSTDNSITGNNITNSLYAVALSTLASRNVVSGNTMTNNESGVIVILSSGNTITGNTIVSSTGTAVHMAGGADSNIVSNNTITESGGSGNNDAIKVESSNSNSITGNNITDANHTSSNTAIAVGVSGGTGNQVIGNSLGGGNLVIDSAATGTILSNNSLGGGTVTSSSLSTVQNGQTDGSGNYVIQPAGSINGITGVATGTAFNFDATNAGANGMSIDVQSNSSSQYILDLTSNNGGNSRLRVRADGRVGIGTTTIDAKLHVRGSADEVQMIVQGNSTQTADIFQVKNNGGTVLAAVSSAGVLRVGATTAAQSSPVLLVTNAEVQGALYVGGAAGNIQNNGAGGALRFTGTAQNSIGITLAPEFAGATMTGTGIGTMTSDFCGSGGSVSVNASICGASQFHNYYNWTTTQSSAQTYSIWTKWRVPSDFASFESTAVQFYGWKSTSSEILTLRFFKNGVACGNGTMTSNGSWQLVNIASLGGCSPSANDELTIQAEMTVTNGNTLRMGEILINYRAQF